MNFSPLVSVYFLSAGLLLMQALYAAVLARPGLFPIQSLYTRSLRIYGLMCALGALFQIACGVQYGATDLAMSVIAHKWINTLMVLIILLGAVQIDMGVGPWPSRNFRLVWGLAVCAVLLCVMNFFSSYGLRFVSIETTRVVSLPWGESIRVLSGTSSSMKVPLIVFFAAVVLYAMRMIVRLFRFGDRLSTALVVLTVFLGMVSGRLAFLADEGVVDLPYMGGFILLAVSFGFLALFGRDIGRTLSQQSHLRSVLSEAIEQIKLSDQVTRLPNLTGVLRLLNPLVEQHRRDSMAMAIFMFEIERLEAINGTHGPGVAEGVLAAVTQRLKDGLRTNDLVARGNGSSFVVVMTGLKRRAQSQLHHQLHSMQLHQKIDALFDKPFLIQDRELRLRCVTGLAVFPDDGATGESLLASAELALHEAKLRGSAGLQTFHPGLRDHLRDQLELETELHAALDRGQFQLHYQPQISASDGRTVGMEALIRWNHPSLGNVAPSRFIPVAESTGIIGLIGRWVLQSACEQLAVWRAAGHTHLRMAVNLSAHQLEQSDLQHVIAGLLGRYGVPPERLELEVTESALIRDPERAISRLESLRALGIRLMLDDFGTGYSSLSYLRILPVHGFKLDRSFIQGITNNARDLAICSTAIQLAQALNLEIVAEGVETREQAEILAAESCTYFQGYWFSRPLASDAATDFLKSAQPKVISPLRRAFRTTDDWLTSAWGLSGPASV